MNTYQTMWHLSRLADSSILGETETATIKAAYRVMSAVCRAYDIKAKDITPADLCELILKEAAPCKS